ncbi:MAG: ATP-binding protein [Flavobacteriales bacterium]|nr:ATP-binding protein [Flavobacteriales bacterium]|tara:strand:- start:3329 stop:3739 length:411 start_codon:yes stop_codon:yes gene_type:complete
MSSAQIQKYQLESEIDSLAKVETIVDELKEQFQIPEDIYGNILVAITEAVNNAIRHGNKLDPEKKVDFSFEYTEKEYLFKIQDKGSGFDPTSIPDPTLPENLDKPDGRGIFIMTNLSDEVKFEDDGRRVEIAFHRS